MDNFLKSQTFKTGVFVLFVLFVLLMVFKMGVKVGIKKALLHQYRGGYDQMVRHKYWGHREGMFKKAMFDKTMFEKKLLLKINLRVPYQIVEKRQAPRVGLEPCFSKAL